MGDSNFRTKGTPGFEYEQNDVVNLESFGGLHRCRIRTPATGCKTRHAYGRVLGKSVSHF